MSKQLPLTIQLRDSASLDNFFAGPNAEALHRVSRGVTGHDSEGAIYLWGAEGCGKTHLLQAACQQISTSDGAAAYLPLRELKDMDASMLEGLESMQVVCVDDVQTIAGDVVWEEGLFHLYNRCFDAGVQIIFAADRNIAELGLALPDLASRLAWGFVLHMRPMGDEDKLNALQLRAKQRGFDLPEKVGQFLLRRCPRDMNALFDTLDALDKYSLAAQRKLTVPFVKEWLEASDAQSEQQSLF